MFLKDLEDSNYGTDTCCVRSRHYALKIQPIFHLISFLFSNLEVPTSKNGLLEVWYEFSGTNYDVEIRSDAKIIVIEPA